MVLEIWNKARSPCQFHFQQCECRQLVSSPAQYNTDMIVPKARLVSAPGHAAIDLELV